YHLKDREACLGWTEGQRRRRLALVANNSRVLIVPGVDCPNLASRVLALNAERLSVSGS
ncbi:MAG: Druantia anti-phage system protein DruA, partial [Verrucomicrobiota bacterium]